MRTLRYGLAFVFLFTSTPFAVGQTAVFRSDRTFVFGSGNASTLEIHSFLNDTIVETKIFGDEPTLHQILDKIAKLNAKAPKSFGISIDEDPLLEDNKTGVHTKVNLPEFPRKLPVRTILSLALHDLLLDDYALHAKKGLLRIVPFRHSDSLVVRPQFLEGRLVDILDHLSEHTGASIAVDPRVLKSADAAITFKVRNSLALHSVLSILVDMADLAVVQVDENLFYVTSPSNAEKWKKRTK